MDSVGAVGAPNNSAAGSRDWTGAAFCGGELLFAGNSSSSNGFDFLTGWGFEVKDLFAKSNKSVNSSLVSCLTSGAFSTGAVVLIGY